MWLPTFPRMPSTRHRHTPSRDSDEGHVTVTTDESFINDLSALEHTPVQCQWLQCSVTSDLWQKDYGISGPHGVMWGEPGPLLRVIQSLYNRSWMWSVFSSRHRSSLWSEHAASETGAPGQDAAHLHNTCLLSQVADNLRCQTNTWRSHSLWRYFCVPRCFGVTCCAWRRQRYTRAAPASSQRAWCVCSRTVYWGSWRTCNTQVHIKTRSAFRQASQHAFHIHQQQWGFESPWINITELIKAYLYRASLSQVQVCSTVVTLATCRPQSSSPQRRRRTAMFGCRATYDTEAPRSADNYLQSDRKRNTEVFVWRVGQTNRNTCR